MNDRFNKNFNDIDPETSRPFSYGHPDGVWIISILFGLPVLCSALGFLATIVLFIFTREFNPAGIVAFIISSVLFLPFILLLFRRSLKTIYYAFGLSILTLAGAVLAYDVQQLLFLVISIFTIAMFYMVYYIFSLKKDGLLGCW